MGETVELKAGRELDRLVAEKVMEMPYHKQSSCNVMSCSFCEINCLDYSTNIKDTWQVVEKMGLSVSPRAAMDGNFNKPDWWAGQLGYDNSVGQTEKGSWADTAPHAICLAALKAKGVI